jgi:hypothetical protein
MHARASIQTRRRSSDAMRSRRWSKSKRSIARTVEEDFLSRKSPLYFPRRIGNVHTVSSQTPDSSLPEFSGCYQVCEAAVCCASLENPYFRSGDAVRGYRSASARFFCFAYPKKFQSLPRPSPRSSRVEFPGDPGEIVLSRHVPVSRYPCSERRNEKTIDRRFSVCPYPINNVAMDARILIWNSDEIFNLKLNFASGRYVSRLVIATDDQSDPDSSRSRTGFRLLCACRESAVSGYRLCMNPHPALPA